MIGLQERFLVNEWKLKAEKLKLEIKCKFYHEKNYPLKNITYENGFIFNFHNFMALRKEGMWI